MRKIVFLSVVVALLVVVNIAPVFACECLPRGTPTEELNKAAAVFSGKVTATRIVQGDQFPEVEVTFDVSTVWKGLVSKTIIVKTADNSAACGYPFRAGEEYIVYAYGEEDDLQTGICTRTAFLTRAQEDLTELGEGKTPESTTTPSLIVSPAQTLVLAIVGIVALVILFFIFTQKTMERSNTH